MHLELLENFGKDLKMLILKHHYVHGIMMQKVRIGIIRSPLKQQYENASIDGEGRVVFNIKGNSYRLVVSIDYDFQVIFIRFIGTHKQYDKINAKTI